MFKPTVEWYFELKFCERKRFQEVLKRLDSSWWTCQPVKKMSLDYKYQTEKEKRISADFFNI